MSLSLLDTVRARKPDQLRVVTDNGDRVELDVPKSGRRWEAVARQLAAYEHSAVRVEMLQDTRVVDTYIFPSDGPRSDDERTVDLVLRAQDMALQRHRDMLDPVLSGYNAVIKTLTLELASAREELAEERQRRRELEDELGEAGRGIGNGAGAQLLDTVVGEVAGRIGDRLAGLIPDPPDQEPGDAED